MIDIPVGRLNSTYRASLSLSPPAPPPPARSNFSFPAATGSQKVDRSRFRCRHADAILNRSDFCRPGRLALLHFRFSTLPLGWRTFFYLFSLQGIPPVLVQERMHILEPRGWRQYQSLLGEEYLWINTSRLISLFHSIHRRRIFFLVLKFACGGNRASTHSFGTIGQPLTSWERTRCTLRPAAVLQ